MDYGGYIKFLDHKVRYVWNDGTYYVLSKIGWGTLNKESLLYKYVIGDKSKNFAIPYMNYFNTTLFLFILIGTIYNLINKEEKTEEQRILENSIVGIFIFLLLWEARSRYIFFMIPIFCILASRGIYLIDSVINKKIEENDKNERKILK